METKAKKTRYFLHARLKIQLGQTLENSTRLIQTVGRVHGLVYQGISQYSAGLKIRFMWLVSGTLWSLAQSSCSLVMALVKRCVFLANCLRERCSVRILTATKDACMHEYSTTAPART